jgi:L-ascorbate metabolism protein UlaG (beta-lactamase superfamily)
LAEGVAVIEKIRWLGHASFKISGEKIIYTDPWKIGAEEKADVICVTHPHHDHCSPEDVARLQKKDTVIVTTADCGPQFKGDVRIISVGQSVKIDGVTIEATPAYNLSKSFHPKANGWVGFIVEMGGSRIYQAGDTDLIQEMKHIRADIALLPVGGTYTMTAEEAAQAAEWIKPKVAVPMHWGDIIGSRADAEKFKRLCTCEVRILESPR